MKTLTARLLLAFALACLGFGAQAQLVGDPGDPAESQASIAKATKFLQLIDKGHLSETWPLTGPHLHGMTTMPEWITALDAMRTRAGKLKGRTFDNAAFTKVIDGAPNGHYYVVFFISKFGVQTFEEKVILNISKGKMQVEGYFLTAIPDPAAPH